MAASKKESHRAVDYDSMYSAMGQIKSPQVDDILSNYKNVIELVPGAQKMVYAIDHPEYGRAVLKIGSYSSKEGLERIRREIAILSGIDSKWYPKNYEFQVVGRARFIITEELIDGRPLNEINGNYQNVRKATQLIIDLVEALMILWDKPAVHRDVKPGNIIITPQGAPRVIDLGIARLLNLDSLTRDELAMGPCIPNYASPEQLENRKTEISHRSDQFSLGIVYGQLLLGGKNPFDPNIVGQGENIPTNILKKCWAKEKFSGLELEKVKPILTKMLGHQPFERYRNQPI